MSKLSQGMNALIRKYDMIPPGSTVICAVSGGADSVYLLQTLFYLRGALPFTLAAAHYNHHLRGAESDRDEQFVRDFVGRNCGIFLGRPAVQLFVGHGDVAAEAKRRKQGVEETAREMRYIFLQELAERLGGALIATAHTADDNAETILHHLVRGTGLQGLTGIPPKRGNLIRPLLTTTRQEIELYLDRRRLSHVEDSSNQDLVYTRNRIRAQVMPVLRDINPGFSRGTAATIQFLREDNDYLNAQAGELSGQAEESGEQLRIPAALIAQAPQPIAIRAVRQLIARLARGCRDCTSAHLEDVVELCRRESPSARLSLPHGISVRREYGTLILAHELTPDPLKTFVPIQGENPVPGTNWTLLLGAGPWPGLTVRPRQAGDEIVLPGRPRRSLKKLFIDQKVPRLERERIPVLADGDGVLAVAGFGPNTAHPAFETAAFEFVR